MESVYIGGKTPLYGEVTIQGSKNAALPIMAAALLVPGASVLKNCPRIADVEYMCRILTHIGCQVCWRGKDLEIDASSLNTGQLPMEYVTRMRSSVMLMGPILGRLGEVELNHPGGCVIGDRPIDIHLKALRRLGVCCEDDGVGLRACSCGLCGTTITLDFPSVGATENVVMAAVAAKGVTCLKNAAEEPEIKWLCAFLQAAGAGIRKVENGNLLIIEGGRTLHPCCFEIPADRIVAGTYLCACLAAGGKIFLERHPRGENGALREIALCMGAKLRDTDKGLWVERTGELISPGMVETGSYPGFPTDLQSPLLVALSAARGESILRETIFNGRFRVVEELNRMGAEIQVRGNAAYIPGRKKLTGARVCAQELRGGAALVAAGLCAQGETVVQNRHYIDRGYEDICRDMRLLGAECR